MKISEVEKYLIDNGFLYDHAEFNLGTDCKRTVYLIGGAIEDSIKIRNLRSKLAKDDTRLVVCTWEVYTNLYSGCPAILDKEIE